VELKLLHVNDHIMRILKLTRLLDKIKVID